MAISGEFLHHLVREHGTPLYVYERDIIERQVRGLSTALGGTRHLICYAVKANSNISLLRTFAGYNLGFDIVSEGELKRVLLAGGEGDKVVFSGVGKTRAEIAYALASKIKFFNVESPSELYIIEEVAKEVGLRAPISFRINPNVKADTHDYLSTGVKTSKFGMPLQDALALAERFRNSAHLQLKAIDCHIGSQITEIEPFAAAYQEIIRIAAEFDRRGLPIEALDLGGGLGVAYSGHTTPLDLDKYGALVRRLFSGTPYELVFEPGRFLIAEAGSLLTRVLYIKRTAEKVFVIVDAGMNDLIRPSLYEAFHQIDSLEKSLGDEREKVDVVGPVCETGCYFAKDRSLPKLAEGDLLAVRDAGAYGFVMASTYNSRRLPAEVLVDAAGKAKLIRRRDVYEDLWRNEIDQ